MTRRYLIGEVELRATLMNTALAVRPRAEMWAVTTLIEMEIDKLTPLTDCAGAPTLELAPEKGGNDRG